MVVGDVGHSTRNNRHNKTRVISIPIHTTVHSPVLLKLTCINDSPHWFLTITVMLVHMCKSGIRNIRFIISIVTFVAFVSVFNKLTVYVALLANSVGGCKIVLKFLKTVTIILHNLNGDHKRRVLITGQNVMLHDIWS